MSQADPAPMDWRPPADLGATPTPSPSASTRPTGQHPVDAAALGAVIAQARSEVATSSPPVPAYTFSPDFAPAVQPYEPPAFPSDGGLSNLPQARVYTSVPEPNWAIARAPERQTDWPASIALAAVIALALGLAAPRSRAWLTAKGTALMHTIRRRAALAICGGLALVFADWRIFAALHADAYWRELHRDGWLALFGALVALLGIYHWIAGPPDHEI